MITLELVLSLVVILVAAAFFTNSVEILGDRLGLEEGAVGSVLAAVGTALPETMIPVVAILGALLFGADPAAAGEIGIGAILGAPFLLATIAMFMVGIAALGFRNHRESGTEITMNKTTALRDMVYFFVFFALAAGAGILPLPFFVKVVLAAVLVVAYIFYIVRAVSGGEDEEADETPEKLLFYPTAEAQEAPMSLVVVQVLGSIAAMAAGAHFFVDGVEKGAAEIGIPAGLVSLVLAPLATELPEKFNSVIWLRANKDTLAMGNITGAMVFQSSLPVALGLTYTAWSLDFINALSAGLALLSGVVLIVLLWRKHVLTAWPLLGGGVLYAGWVAAAIYTLVS